MTNIVLNDQTSTIHSDSTNHALCLCPLDCFSFQDHRGLVKNVLVVSADYNPELYPYYLDIVGIVDGKVQKLSLNKNNITERMRLIAAQTNQTFSVIKKYFSASEPMVGDFVIDSANRLSIVASESYSGSLVKSFSTDGPAKPVLTRRKDLQVVENIRLDFVKLENMYDIQCNWRYRRTI